MNLYQVIRDQPEDLIQALKNPVLRNTRKDYLELRQVFNGIREDPAFVVERAALLLYLNRHGYNGLWRVNQQGAFNVPFGRYQHPRLPSNDAIREFSRMLEGVEILHEDFSNTVARAKKGDFVYFDPPYHPISTTANFTDYAPGGFGYREQIRLAALCCELRDRGVAVMVSNSKTTEILSLYRDFTIQPVTASRAINSRPEGRKGIIELIITSYHQVHEKERDLS